MYTVSIVVNSLNICNFSFPPPKQLEPKDHSTFTEFKKVGPPSMLSNYHGNGKVRPGNSGEQTATLHMS